MTASRIDALPCVESSRVDVVTLGESMVLFQPLRDGPLAHEPLLTRTIAGAESNVAIALARLGKKTRWVSRLGCDPFGDIIRAALAGEGVDVSFVVRDETAPTAVFFREIKGYGDPNVYYFRKHSAASNLSPNDVNSDWMGDARHLHVTGITCALSESAREATMSAMQLARKMGLTISFDPNLRRKLWDEQTARKTLLDLMPLCDIFLPGIDEAEFLCGERSPSACAKHFFELGSSLALVVLKMGDQGAVAFTPDIQIAAPAHRVQRMVDSIGAGDAFAAGLLSVLLGANPPLEFSIEILENALQRANLLGALATQFRGDWEGLPTIAEVQRMEANQREIAR